MVVSQIKHLAVMDQRYCKTVPIEIDFLIVCTTIFQRLSDELERSCRDREELEKELERERRKTKAPEIGFKEMENRWKLATTECSKLSFQVKTLRGENDMMTARQREFQER